MRRRDLASSLLCGSVAAFLGATPALGGQRAVPPAGALLDQELSRLLESRNKEERQQAFFLLGQLLSAWEDRLIDIAKREKEQYEWSDSRLLAVLTLGKLGSLKAIPVLVEHIEFKAPMFVTEDIRVRGYPCAMALLSIGQSAVPEVFRQLHGRAPDEVSDHAIEVYARWFIDLYHGPSEGGAVEALDVVRRAMERNDKENLRRLHAKLDDMTRDFSSRQR